MKMKLVRYKGKNAVGSKSSGTVVAILGEAKRLYTPLVWIDSPIRLRKISNHEVKNYTSELHGKLSTVKRAARTMLKAGKRLNITKAARKFLNEAAKS